MMASSARAVSAETRQAEEVGGKTVTRRLTDAELAEYQPLFDNAKKLRALLAELQNLTLEIIKTDGEV